MPVDAYRPIYAINSGAADATDAYDRRVSALRARESRVCAALFFLTLLLTISVQSRLAEIDFNDDGAPGFTFENGDTMDGDEVLTRLVLVDDLVMPYAPAPGTILLWWPPVGALAQVFPAPLRCLASRAPPALPSSV